MINIYVARHGQDQDNANGILNGHRNESLTELGRQQARDVGNKMLQAGFCYLPASASSTGTSSANNTTTLCAIYASPLQRAYETAEIFSKILSSGTEDESSSKVKKLDILIERDFGIMTGMPTSSILEKCGSEHVLVTEKVNYFLDPEGAETFPDLMARAKKALAYIKEETSGIDAGSGDQKSILLVTHGDFGKMLYAAFYDLDWKEVLSQFHFGNSDVLLLSKDSGGKVFETAQNT